MPDYDAIIIGAGHNGLTAGTVLARAGLKVLVVERTGWVGGMAATKQLFPGFKHNVGAWALLVLPDAMQRLLELERYGVEILTPRTSYCVFGAPEDPCFLAYADPGEFMQDLLARQGPEALNGLMGLFEFMQPFANVMGSARLRPPEPIDAIIAAAPDARTREALTTCFYGTVIDVIRKFFPDPTRHRCIGGSLAAMSIDATHKGPYSPGSACSMAYHYTVSGGANLFKMAKGGMGAVSDALCRSFEAHGGTVQYRADVKRLWVENGRAAGVQLHSGEQISARVVLSSVDARSTFLKLVGEELLPIGFVHAVKEIEYTNGYIQIHLTLKELPEFTGHLAFANDDEIRWLMSYIPSAEHLSRCWEQYRRNEVPDDPVSYCYIPSVKDPSLAPAGYHSCTIFSHYFPPDGSRAEHDANKDLMAARVIGRIAKHAPNFHDAIIDKAVLTHRYFEGKFAITAGDFAHGLLHPGQMWERRPVPGWADYRTPIANLFMCGSSCHPGPGVTGLPGYNSAHEVLRTWDG